MVYLANRNLLFNWLPSAVAFSTVTGRIKVGCTCVHIL